MNKLEELWAKFQLWRRWRRVQAGEKPVDLVRYAGYFFPVDLLGYNPLEKEHLIKMASDKLMRAKLLSYKTCNDPADMIKEASYHYIGYEDEKAFADMTWPEYRSIFYAN